MVAFVPESGPHRGPANEEHVVEDEHGSERALLLSEDLAIEVDDKAIENTVRVPLTKPRGSSTLPTTELCVFSRHHSRFGFAPTIEPPSPALHCCHFSEL